MHRQMSTSSSRTNCWLLRQQLSSREKQVPKQRDKAADIISNFLLWTSPRWNCLLVRHGNETTSLSLAFRAIWNPKMSLQSLSVLTICICARNKTHRHERGEHKWDSFCWSLQRGKEREGGACLPCEMLAKTDSKAVCLQIPSSCNKPQGDSWIETKSILPSCSNSTSTENGAKINTQMKLKLPQGKLTEKYRQKNRSHRLQRNYTILDQL